MSKEIFKKVATEFFYYWWNAEGNNTEEGFDKWWNDKGEELVKKCSIPNIVGKIEQLPLKCIDDIDKELCERIKWCELCKNIER